MSGLCLGCGKRGPGFGRCGVSRRANVLEGEPVGGAAGVDRVSMDVRRDAGAFPVAAGYRIDCFGDGNGRLQVRMHGEAFAGMGTAAGALADDAGPAELLQVVAELLTAGERAA